MRRTDIERTEIEEAPSPGLLYELYFLLQAIGCDIGGFITKEGLCHFAQIGL